jgi:hypothetical protein
VETSPAQGRWRCRAQGVDGGGDQLPVESYVGNGKGEGGRKKWVWQHGERRRGREGSVVPHRWHGARTG